MKRKNETADYVAESGEQNPSSAYTEVVNNALQTPVSGKGGKAQKASRIAKCNNSGSQTPACNIGEHGCKDWSIYESFELPETRCDS